MAHTEYPSIDGTLYRRTFKPGPPAMGFEKYLASLPPEHLAVMRYRCAISGGYLTVAEQIRAAVKLYLSGGLV